jgi:hypothetical protein
VPSSAESADSPSGVVLMKWGGGCLKMSAVPDNNTAVCTVKGEWALSAQGATQLRAPHGPPGGYSLELTPLGLPGPARAVERKRGQPTSALTRLPKGRGEHISIATL